MRTFPLSKVYSLLEPGPVVLLVTTRNRRNNVMTMSWHTMMEFTPPLIGCIVSNRNYSFGSLKAAGECVIAVPTVKLAAKVVRIGNTSGRKTDKFKSIGLTARPAAGVAAPLIAECYANLECRVVDTALVSAYNFFVLEVRKAWIDAAAGKPDTIHHLGKGVFRVAGKTVTFPSRMK